MPNLPLISIQNAINATKLIDRALDDLDKHYNNEVLDRDRRAKIAKIRSNNSHNRFLLERMK